jgi:ribosome maturation factor RimP
LFSTGLLFEVPDNVKPALEALVIEELTPLGLELVELKLGGSNGRPVIDVRVDRLDGQKITVGECAVASRAIEARLEAQPNLITSRYVLEVSSPGMERPLRKAAEWKRFVGRSASINSPELGGRHEMVIVAVEGPDGAEKIRVKDGKGIEKEIALSAITDARLVFHWKP